MRAQDLQRRLTSGFAKHVTNRLYRLAFNLGFAPPGTAILETVGRRSGLPRRTPVTNGLEGDTFWIVTEHGSKTSYVLNIESEPRVRILVGRQWRTGTAQLAPDEDPIRRLQLIAGQNRAARRNTRLVKLVGTDLTCVRVTVDPRDALIGR